LKENLIYTPINAILRMIGRFAVGMATPIDYFFAVIFVIIIVLFCLGSYRFAKTGKPLFSKEKKNKKNK